MWGDEFSDAMLEPKPTTAESLKLPLKTESDQISLPPFFVFNRKVSFPLLVLCF